MTMKFYCYPWETFTFSNTNRGGEDGRVGVDQRGLVKHLAGEEGKETAVRM